MYQDPTGTALAAVRIHPPKRRIKLMKKLKVPRPNQEGKVGYILAWLLGVPIPVLFVIFLLRGCT